MKWFRFYHDALDDPKVQRLPGDLFKFWVNMLCLGSQSDERGVVKLDLGEIAFALRLDDDAAAAMVADLVKRNLLEESTDGLQIHNWDSRQFKSDNVTERVTKHRARVDSVPDDVSETLHETLHETLKPSVNTDYRVTDTESDTEREGNGADAPALPPVAPPEQPKPKRATRLPDDFAITDEMRRWAIEQGASAIQVERETDKFRDYYRAAAGSKGVKLDWPATWRNWIRRGVDDAPRGNGSLTVHNGGQYQPRANSMAGFEAYLAELDGAISDDDDVIEAKASVR